MPSCGFFYNMVSLAFRKKVLTKFINQEDNFKCVLLKSAEIYYC